MVDRAARFVFDDCVKCAVTGKSAVRSIFAFLCCGLSSSSVGTFFGRRFV